MRTTAQHGLRRPVRPKHAQTALPFPASSAAAARARPTGGLRPGRLDDVVRLFVPPPPARQPALAARRARPAGASPSLCIACDCGAHFAAPLSASSRYGAARRGAARRGTALCGASRRGAARHGAVRRGAARRGAARRGTVRRGTVRRGTARRGTARHCAARRGALPPEARAGLRMLACNIQRRSCGLLSPPLRSTRSLGCWSRPP
jgi:hypothetical protein